MADIVADITLKDNSAEVKRILKSAVKRGLKAIGMAAEWQPALRRFHLKYRAQRNKCEALPTLLTPNS